MSNRELEKFKKRLHTIGLTPTENIYLKKTSLRILLMDVFTTFFMNFSTGNNDIPLWLEMLCTHMRTTDDFKEGGKKMLALSGRTREHLSRSMKKYTGQTVSEFISGLRLTYIANMLQSSNMSISEIIFDSGFNSINSATTLFKKKYGVSMRDFRRSDNESNID